MKDKDNDAELCRTKNIRRVLVAKFSDKDTNEFDRSGDMRG